MQRLIHILDPFLSFYYLNIILLSLVLAIALVKVQCVTMHKYTLILVEESEFLSLPFLCVYDLCVSQFSVHLGMARGSSVVILEQTGRNSGYRDKDICGFCPESHCCLEGGPERLDSVINMKSVFKQFKRAQATISWLSLSVCLDNVETHTEPTVLFTHNKKTKKN